MLRTEWMGSRLKQGDIWKAIVVIWEITIGWTMFPEQETWWAVFGFCMCLKVKPNHWIYCQWIWCCVSRETPKIWACATVRTELPFASNEEGYKKRRFRKETRSLILCCFSSCTSKMSSSWMCQSRIQREGWGWRGQCMEGIWSRNKGWGHPGSR